jgi:phenylacetate-CoA ligase
VEQFKIIQHGIDRTEVLLVVTSAFTSASEQRIVDDFKGRLGRTVSIEISRVDRIDSERSGKFRYVVSRVPTERTARAEQAA